MPRREETKNERFLRLMQRRLERALNELRLVSQLASPNYENTPEQAEEVVEILDDSIRHIASVFGVEYATRIGRAASRTANGASPIQRFQQKTILDEIEIVRILGYLRNDEIEEAERILRSALNGHNQAA